MAAIGRGGKSVQEALRPDRRPANKGRKYPAEVLSEADVAALLEVCSRKAPTGIRNRALITVLYRAGLRVSEALSLSPNDIDAHAGTITVFHGKGDGRRVVGLEPGAFAVLAHWLDRRAALGLDGRSPIFCTLRGASVKSAYVRALLPRLAARAGVKKRVHPHGLRHTHAAELAREGTPLNLVQAQLGHGSLATTDRYLKHIARDERGKATKARIWTPEED
jgi:site-specific recombinase XerD